MKNELPIARELVSFCLLVVRCSYDEAAVLRDRLLEDDDFAAVLFDALELFAAVLLEELLPFVAVLFAAVALFAVDEAERVRGVDVFRAGAVRRFGTRTYSTASGFRSINAFRMPIE